MPDNLETITFEITKPKAKPFLLNTWYRPPDMPVDVFTDYEILMQKMDHENKEIISSYRLALWCHFNPGLKLILNPLLNMT